MINTLTLNPAIDKILYVKEFQRNVTTRIQRIKETIGGKGTHVSINLQIMGMPSRAFGIAHGHTGAHVIELLEQQNVETHFILHAEQETRTNYLLAESTGDATLITEKGVELAEKDLEDMMVKLDAETQSGDFLVFSGDASNYADPFVYNHIMSALQKKGLKFFVDTSGKSLKKAVESKPFLIKPNLDELELLAGRSIKEDDREIITAIKALEKYNIAVVAVSLGGNGSIVKHYDTFYRVYPAKVNAVNTVGCGDCFLAGLLYGFARDTEIEATLRFATAAGAAAAECELSVGLDIARAKELEAQVKIKKIV